MLLFLARTGGLDGWLRLADGGVVARGAADDALPPAADPLHVVGVVPGEDVALHWVELPAGLAPAQASAAARLLAVELTAQPIEELHVAAGPQADGLRCIAIAPAIRMESWIATCRALGRDPDMLVPEPLLLLPRDEHVVRFDKAPLPLFRGRTDAFSIEPELAQAALGSNPVATIDAAAFEDGLGEAVAASPVNLRQGAFAKARKWRLERRVVRRLVLLAAAVLLMSAVIQIASILRYTFDADRMEAEAALLAQRALPRGVAANDPVRQLERRLVDVQGTGAGFGILATGLFDAVKATPNAELAAIIFEGGELRAMIVADTPATLTAIETRLEGQGFQVENGAATIRNGRQAIEMIVRGR